ncbi:MAG: hypothetical protein F4076_02280 [Acidimicrobiaceae bacterium]|nr:hypothetical protein [Acidimicrobiaceae bacterium]MYE76025.1 hypothetical protein [Acidimicrobiaceae bacterium]MYJ41263.1 hypothetical protein [Acidimicrobiaceae bacterium]
MTDETRSSPATAGSGRPSSDSGARDPNPGDVWPVYSGKSFNIWEPDTGAYYDSVDAVSITTHLHRRRLSQSRTARSAFAGTADSLLRDASTLSCRRARVVFRDVTNPTNTRTIVAALIPPRVVITNKGPYLLQTRGGCRDEAFVLGLLASMIMDWCARRTVEMSLNFHVLNALPVPDPGEGHPVRDRVVEIAGRLAAVDDRFADWARNVGVPVGSVNDRKAKDDLIAELDACVAHLYGLDEDDLAVLYSTFDARRPDRYAEHHARVLTHYRRLTP